MKPETDTSDIPWKPEKPKFKFGCFSMLLILLFVGFVSLTTFLVLFRASGERRYQALITRMKTHGQPVTIDEVAAAYESEDTSVEAAAMWSTVLAQIEQSRLSATTLPIVGTGPNSIPRAGTPWPEQAEVEGILASHQQLLDDMHRAARLDTPARFDLQFRDGYNMTLSQVQGLREVARLARLEGQIAAYHGDRSKALQAIRVTLAAARSLEHDPIMISQLVQSAIASIAEEQMVEFLPVLEFTDSELAELQNRFRTADVHAQTMRGLCGEQVLGLHSLEKSDVTMAVDAPLPGLLRSAQRLGLQGDAIAAYGEYIQDVIEGGELPVAGTGPDEPNWALWIQRTEAAQQKLDQLIQGGIVNRGRYALTAMAPSLSNYIQAMAKREARRRAVDGIIGARRFQLQQKELPQSWHDLVPNYLPAIPLDPFTSQPLGFLRSDQEVRIYSVGPDRIDHQGIFEPNGKNGPADIGFALPALSAPPIEH